MFLSLLKKAIECKNNVISEKNYNQLEKLQQVPTKTRELSVDSFHRKAINILFKVDKLKNRFKY